MKFFDAFGGIGGFRLGMERAGHQCVGYCEIDPAAVGIYNLRFEEQHDPNDIRNLHDLPDFDILCGGFPCQSFSIAGDRGGLDDPRGNLFYELARLLRDYQPSHFVFENVPHLLSHDGGATFREILTALGKLGYGLEWQICDLRDFGSPQGRKRILLVGHLGGLAGYPVFPLRTSERVYCSTENGRPADGEWFWGRDRVSTLTANYRRGVHCGGETYVLMNHLLYPGDYPLLWMDDDGNAYMADNPRHPDDELLDVGCPYCGMSFSECTCLGVGSVFETGDVESVILRRLTPLECERLQGFPDGWTKEKTVEGVVRPVADGVRYGALGNALPPAFAEAVGKRLMTPRGCQT